MASWDAMTQKKKAIDDEGQLVQDEQQNVIDQLGEPGYDKNVAKDYENTVEPGIDSAFYGRSKDLAAEYARRGLGQSGMSAQAQTDESFNRAAKLRQMKQKAIDYAKNQRRQQLVDEALMWNDYRQESADYAKLGAQDQQNDINALVRLGSLGFVR